MFYLVEKKKGYYGYVLDTDDGVVERVSMAVFNKTIKRIHIEGARADLNSSVPCVPRDNVTVYLSQLSSACTLVLTEIYTHNNHGKIITRFAGKAYLMGNAGVVGLKNWINNGIVSLKTANALSTIPSDMFEVSIIFEATSFKQLPDLMLTDYLIFNYINDADVDYLSVNKRIMYPFIASEGLSQYVSMFTPLNFADESMTYWDLRRYLLNKYKVLRVKLR